MLHYEIPRARKPFSGADRRNMKRLSAIILTFVLVAAFALALTACNPVEKTETFNATKADIEAVCKDEATSYAHYQVAKTSQGVTSSFELYLIDYSELPENYGLLAGYSVYIKDSRSDGSVRYRLASGIDSRTALYGDAIVNADSSVQYSYAVTADNYAMESLGDNNIYNEVYGLTSFPTATSVHGEYKSDIATPKTTLTNAFNSADCTITAERNIKGKDVVSKVYTVAFDFGDGSTKSKGTVTVRTDGSDNVTEIAVAWENGDSCSTKYVYDGTGEVGYDNIFDVKESKAFFTLCGVPEKDLTKM